MPIYEFACDRCRKVYQFFFRTASSRAKPRCPGCGARGLRRQLSGFAVQRKAGGNENDQPADDIDPVRAERAMAKLERQMDRIDENNPREMGKFMRHMFKETGMGLEPELETAIRRLEAGEDPDSIEEDMGEILGGGSASGDSSKGDSSKGPEYGYDENLYEA